MRRLLLLTAAFAAFTAVTFAQGDVAPAEVSAVPEAEAPAVEKLYTEAELLEMRIPELRRMLVERAQVCERCRDKTDYVKRVMEVQHMPTVRNLSRGPGADGKPGSEEAMKRFKELRERTDRLRAAMREQGLDPLSVDPATVGGLEQLSDEDAIRVLAARAKHKLQRKDKRNGPGEPQGEAGAAGGAGGEGEGSTEGGEEGGPGGRRRGPPGRRGPPPNERKEAARRRVQEARARAQERGKEL